MTAFGKVNKSKIGKYLVKKIALFLKHYFIHLVLGLNMQKKTQRNLKII